MPKYRLVGLSSDRFITEIELPIEPEIGEEVLANDQLWIVKDKDIGSRQTDEIYVQTPNGREPPEKLVIDRMTGEGWYK